MDSNEHVSSHALLFKNDGKSFESIRKSRQLSTIELRKTTREELIQKKRNEALPMMTDKSTSVTITTVEQAAKLVMDCASPIPEVYQNAILNLRLYLSMDKVNLIEELLSRNIVDVLVSHLIPSENVDVRYNSTWALTNIASGSSHNTSYLLKDNVILALGRLLYEKNPTLVEQAIWALSNIMGDGPSARAYVLKLNLLSILGQVLVDHANNISVLKQFSWMLINICRKKETEVSIEYVPQIVPLINALLDVKDESVVSDCLWAITHLADSSSDHISMMITGSIIENVFKYFHANPKLSISALRAVGNVAASIDEHTQYLLDHKIYKDIAPLFNTSNPKIKKEVYWLLSNIAAGTREQMLSLFSLNLFPQIIKDLENDDYQVQREACWVISNVLHSSSIEESQPFIDSKILFLMNKFVISQDTSMVILVLEVVLILLRLYTSHNKQLYICERVEESGILDSIETIQNHSNRNIYNFTNHILEKYFSEGDSQIFEASDQASGFPPNTGSDDTLNLSENQYDF